MMGKREATKAILDGKGADRIPVIMNAFSLPVVQYGFDMFEALTSPEKMTECMVGTRRRLGYDGLCAGTHSICGAIAGHLENSEGRISGDGSDTIRSLDDLKKLRPYEPEKDPMLASRLKTIEMMRKEEPDEPVFVITMHPTSEAFNLLGATPAFKLMIKDPGLFRAVAEYVEESCLKVCKILGEAADFLWFPTPNFGGFCISRKAYKNCIYDSNVSFINKLKQTGTKIVLHTCGLYDDRLDLVLDEHGDAWHLADTSTKKIKDLYGDQVALMGTIPSVHVMMEYEPEKLYSFAYQECMDGAWDGRFILSADCDVPPSTSDENMKAVVRAAKDAEKVLFAKTTHRKTL